jgi:hypothetical protein
VLELCLDARRLDATPVPAFMELLRTSAAP